MGHDCYLSGAWLYENNTCKAVTPNKLASYDVELYNRNEINEWKEVIIQLGIFK